MRAVAAAMAFAMASGQVAWSISTASTTTQALTAVILVVIGLVHFGEHLTLQRGLGLVLCVAGAAMVAR